MSVNDYLGYLEAGDYKPCVNEIEDKNAAESNNDRIRDNFDLAMIRHYQKDYDSSLSILNETDRLMEDSVTKSISKGFAAAIANDNAAEYEATPYEYVPAYRLPSCTLLLPSVSHSPESYILRMPYLHSCTR